MAVIEVKKVCAASGVVSVFLGIFRCKVTKLAIYNSIEGKTVGEKYMVTKFKNG